MLRALRVLALIATILLSRFPPATSDEFAFFDACQDGDVAIVRELLDADAVDLDYADGAPAAPALAAASPGVSLPLLHRAQRRSVACGHA